jgi:hypothetical protein
MWRWLFRPKRKRCGWHTRPYKKYYAEYERALRENPEKIENEQEMFLRTVLHMVEKRQQRVQGEKGAINSRSDQEQARIAVMAKMRELARASFMKHPAATEAGFRACWPTIRTELLKQYALDELASQPERLQTLLLQSENSHEE